VKPIDVKKLPDFQSFCETKFRLSHYAKQVKDRRGEVKIKASTVFSAVLLMGAMGWGSLLRCDQMIRTPIGQRWFKRKPPAVSDSTMARSLTLMELPCLRPILLSSYRLGVNSGQSKYQLRDGKRRIGIIDSSGFGRFLASCFEIVGPTSLMVGLQRIEKRGKELPASYALLRRLKHELNANFVDLILGDGLYLVAPFFNLCLGELQADVLVKTDDTTRQIIADAMGLFGAKEQFSSGIITAEGTDAVRMCHYQVTMADGFFLKGVDTDLTVAWVIETHLRTGELTEFWVITSAKSLLPQEVRELAHWRWDVENHGFKSLNQTVVTKRIYSHDPTASEAILLILFIVFNLLSLFLLRVSHRLTYPGMKPTRLFRINLLRHYLIVLGYLFDG